MLEPFGRYSLLEKIALGGMAEIFLAKLVGVAGFEKKVAIKRILPHWSQNHEFIRMLIDEAKIAVSLTHPNIVSVYELGKEGEHYYIAMEYVEGIDLRRLFRRCQEIQRDVPFPLAVWIIGQVLKGLQYAHKREDAEQKSLQIVHRDVSPQNILLSFDGQVKVADFGIARAANRSSETATGTLKGKFSYMSPEQAGQEALDARTDLFSTGILLYELLTRRRLFSRPSDISSLEAVRRAEVSLPENILLPSSLKKILLKSLARKKEDRFQEAGEFLKNLEEWLLKKGSPVGPEQLSRFLEELFPRGERHQVPMEKSGQEGTPLLRVRKSEKKEKRSFLKPIGALLLLLVGISLFVFFNRTKQMPPTIATETKIETKEEVAPLPKNGFISIQAVPWGLASVDGVSLKETPIHKKAFRSGDHLVEVHYEPLKKHLSQKILLKEGVHLHCLARFSEKESGLICRP
ncbi:MAG: serine/threonine-protein kinase [bacterium]|nr:serine/threonine-protein kinase [bacterium]